VNVCRNGIRGSVGMESCRAAKSLKSLERVKGIEPSYSAWKAAALPLSYTRICSDHVSRQAGGLNRDDAVCAGLPFPDFGAKRSPFQPLTATARP
jgi:hypothetical protein